MSQTLVPTDPGPSEPAPVPAGGPTATAEPRRSTPGLYRAFWRWHFYASALVVPVFAVLAVTGLLMLFKWQLDPLQEPALRFTPPAHGAMLPLGQQEAAALERFPGAGVTAVQTASGDRSTFFTLETAEGTTNVYVDPYTGEVLGSRDPRTLLSNVATEIHGMLVFGDPSDRVLFEDPVTGEDFTVGSIGDRLIELATCWALVMALTGYVLYVRGRRARLAASARRVRGAVLRRRHATIGAWAGIGILAMVLTGLPWTGLWGSTVQKWATGSSFALWGEDPGATSTLGQAVEDAGSDSLPAPWAEGAAPLPESGGHHHGGGAATGGAAAAVGIDRVLATAAADGLPAPYYVTYPDSPEGVFSVLSDMWHDKDSAAYEDVTQERVVHVDQYSGAVAGRYSYDEYAPAARLVSQGIALHEGQRFGSVSFWTSAAFCVAVLALCVTGPLMWWRRRRSGLAAPRGALPVRATPWLLVALVALGVFLPLFGVTLVLVLLLDRWVVRRNDRLAGALGTTPLRR